VSDYLSQMKTFEGYTPHAAWDHKQHTNGYGTRARHPGEVIDREEAERRFQAETEKAGAFVDSLGVPMSPGQRAALTDLTFNAGTKWAESGLGDAVRSGNWDDASGRFLQYNKAGGETLPGLVSRRQQGAAWMRGDAPKETEMAALPYGPQAPAAPQGAFGNMQANFAKSPVGILKSGLERGDSTDIQAGLGGTLSGALGAFGQVASAQEGSGGPDLSKAAMEANAQALSAEDQKQMAIIQGMQQRRQAGAFA
jgi:GH24 family phage-related lysozyme (muramidase)